MANILCPFTPYQTLDLAGLPYAQAVMWFTLPDTDTPVDAVYEDEDGTSQHTNPVTADSRGEFPPAYVPDDQAVRVRLFETSDTSSTPIWELDFTPPGGSAATYTIGTSGGTIPVNNGDNDFSGDVVMSGTLSITGTFSCSGAATFSGATALPAAATAGGQRIGWREIPLTQKNADYTFVLTDAAKGYYKDDTSAYSYTIPPNSSVAFPTGTIIQVINNGSSGVLTIVRGSGVACRLAGVVTDDDWDIAAYGEATIQKIGTDSWIIRGTSVST